MIFVPSWSPLSISIHALREESDRPSAVDFAPCILFQSTLSVRRATDVVEEVVFGEHISIHALREESDWKGRSRNASGSISIHALREESDISSCLIACSLAYFNPRSP